MSLLNTNKICMISPLGYTGIAYYDHSLCQSLSELSWDVTLITSKVRAITPDTVSYNVKSFFVDTYGEISRSKKGINYVFSMIKVLCFILKNQYKTIHFQILEIPPVDFIFFLLFRLFGIRIIFTPHDIYSLKKSSDFFLKKQYLLCDNIIAHNRANKIYLVEKSKVCADKISILKHGNYDYFLRDDITRDDARKKIGISLNAKVVLLFGNIRKGKGIETTVSSIKFLSDIKNLLILIVGKAYRSYDMEQLIDQILREGGKEQVVVREGFVKNDMVEYYYKASDVVLVPYETGSESGVLKYAFSCGLPVVVSDMEEFSDFAIDGENCLVFKRGDANSLANNMRKALNEIVISKKISENAKALSSKTWRWHEIAQGTAKVYLKQE